MKKLVILFWKESKEKSQKEINLLEGGMSNKFLIFGILVVLLAGNAMALGITPARTTVDFEPGLEREIGFSIINTEKEDVDLVIYSQGELADSILLNQNSLTLSSGEESRQLSYRVRLPQTLGPGLHTAEVVVLELPGSGKVSEAFVGSAVGVVTQLYVYVPYPGKYAEAQLNIIGAERGEEVTFVMPVVSMGDLDLVDVKANVDIYNKLGEKIDSFNTASIPLKSKEKAELVHKLGEIAKFEMLVENKWSEPVIGAYAQTQIYNEKDEVMSDFKSATYDIPALSKAVMISYWDSGGVRKGTYDASVFLRYAEKSSQKNLQLKIYDDKIEIIGLGFVISEGVTKDNTKLIMILIGVIVVLVIVNLAWFMFLRKKLFKGGA
jgi:hypothetical protein